MKVVVALGGNALLQRDEKPTAEAQGKNLRRAGGALAELAREHSVVITHGNGPQVGLLASQALAGGFARPLDVLSAETVGMIGYLIQQELGRHLPDRPVATLLTLVEVDPDDPAFDDPTKPIGPVLPEEEARNLAERYGWALVEEGDGLRRVVPSPTPLRVLEQDTIRLLVNFGVLVICGGGGGMPVRITEEGWIRGVEAVVDKDTTASLLARELEADALLLLTDVPGVEAHWGTPEARLLRRTTPEELRSLEFDPGSMGPKVEAACRFVEATGAMAGIGEMSRASEILAGNEGTLVEPSG